MVHLKLRKLSMNSLIMIAFIIFVLYSTAVNAAGFRELESDGVKIGVWYPSDQVVTEQRLGPFDVKMARNGRIISDDYPIVLLSHGIGGRYRNHHLTAQHLADAGFVVVAPQHQADYQIGGNKTPEALNRRYQELSIALKAVMNDTELKNNVNSDLVHGIGYSLGGATMLLGAGATFSFEQANDYCETHESVDAEFCDDPNGWIYRLIESFRNRVELPETRDTFSNPPLINGDLILVATVSQGFSLDSLGPVKSLNVLAIDGDIIAKPKFHSEPIFEVSSSKFDGELWYIKGHHFAFIAPFSDRVPNKESISVAVDPEGFDRSDFLEKINEKILSLLLSN